MFGAVFKNLSAHKRSNLLFTRVNCNEKGFMTFALLNERSISTTLPLTDGARTLDQNILVE
jgi:hypothetical protein